MNSFAVFLAFVMLLATALAGPGGNRYGWPSSYERFLEKKRKEEKTIKKGKFWFFVRLVKTKTI
ncbi:Protein CBG14828 [Caenorhabditis briggsae]|uniref:Protein CBG14828 n=1 Tax=Caenorhabditis briggsae TaxID=6238 RepID=A8XKS5_CAEBR|nr:Protein CBG14828 [Caenorhabditis briggsae]CAP33249.2 Protein CBG14828 [Caenorhabditis briggsae]